LPRPPGACSELVRIPHHFLTARGEEADIVAGLELGADYPVTERAVDVQIVGLRRKLGAAGALIETIRGVGYCQQPGARLLRRSP
jgi:DNA-binding response OmpR family regulator